MDLSSKTRLTRHLTPGVRWVPAVPMQRYTSRSEPGRDIEPRPWHRQGWFWLIVAVVALGIVVVLGLAALGQMHALVASSNAQVGALQKQTAALGGVGAALTAMQQTLQSIAASLQAIARELAQLVGVASAHAGPAAAAVSSASASQ